MKPKLMIHAGIHRTGTTAIQYKFSHNRAALLSRGVLYPGEGVNHEAIAWALHRKQLSGADLVALLETEITPAITSLVLSAEDFAMHKTLAWLKPLTERFDCRATIYLRRQDEWLMSWYNQHIKWPFDAQKSRMSPEEFLLTLDDYHWLDFEALLHRWAEALGQDRIHVGVVERGGIVDTAAELLGRIGLDGLAEPEKNANESIPASVAEILRHLSVFKLSSPQRLLLLQAVRQSMMSALPQSAAIYAPAVRNRIINRFAAGNAAVARRFLGREDGMLFRQKSCPANEPFSRPRLPGSEELLEKHIGPLIGQLLAVASRSAKH